MMTTVDARIELDPSLTAPRMAMSHLYTVVEEDEVVTLPFAWSNNGTDGELSYAVYNGTAPEVVGNINGPHGPYYHTQWSAEFRCKGPCVILDARGHFWICEP